MPEMNGIEFLETVRGTYPELPFILFTGKGSEQVASDAIAAGVGALAVPVLGDRYLTVVGRLDYTRLSVATLAGLVVLTALLTGLVGGGVFIAATILGLVPPRYGARRVHLMGVLTGPLALGI